MGVIDNNLLKKMNPLFVRISTIERMIFVVFGISILVETYLSDALPCKSGCFIDGL